MHYTHRILSVLLALMLVGSNMAFSSHVSSHIATDSSLCSLCIHPGGTDTAIVPEAVLFFVILSASTLKQGHALAPFLPLILHDHQSRAPPSVT
jgi:hypothetical protein